MAEKKKMESQKTKKKQEVKTQQVSQSEPEKTYYTKEELQEFKELILEKLAEARQEYEELEKILHNITEMANKTSNLTEFASDMLEKEQTKLMLNRLARYIEDLERALIRIENGTYGICKHTGKLIPKERLRLVPHTESSIEAKLSQSQTSQENEWY